jgi:hypothetical protein
VSSPQIIGAAIGLFIGGIIFWLIRRDHMVSKDGIRWLMLAGFIMVYGAFPKLNDLLGEVLGIIYPPIIPVLLGLGAILIKLLINDTERVKTRVDIERMIQRMAMLEAELEQMKATVNNDETVTIHRDNVQNIHSK